MVSVAAARYTTSAVVDIDGSKLCRLKLMTEASFLRTVYKTVQTPARFFLTCSW